MKHNKNLALVVIEGIFANLMFGSLFVWSVLRNPLLSVFPTWTEGMLSVIFGIHNLFVCMGILAAGALRKRFSSRQTFVIYTIMVVIGMVGFAFLPINRPTLSYVLAFIFFCCFTATGVGIGINTVQSTTIPWFPNNSGTISGVLYMALGVSSVILAAIARKLLEVISVIYVLPVFGGAVLIISLLILADRKSVTMPVVAEGDNELVGVTTSQMLRSGTFICLIIWNVCLRTCGLILLDHAASMASFYGGAVLTAMLIAPANGLGSVTVGVIMDKIGLKKIMLVGSIIMLLAGGVLHCGILSARYFAVFVGLLLGGFAYGGSSSSYAAGIKNSFGSKHYTQNFAVSNVAMGCAALIESTSGSVLDKLGSYSAVSGMVVIFAIIGMVLAIVAQKVIVPFYIKEK